MKLLLDTHVLLWAAAGSRRLSSAGRRLIEDEQSELFFSIGSIWEVVIKRGLGRSDFQVDPRVLRRRLLDNGYSELPIVSEHVLALDGLPAIHRDPFDRLLVAQAMVEGMTLLTLDPMVARYPGSIRRL